MSEQAKAVVELAAADLLGPGVTPCPNPKMALWSNHPRCSSTWPPPARAGCPYCGTLYRLKAGETLHAAH